MQMTRELVFSGMALNVVIKQTSHKVSVKASGQKEALVLVSRFSGVICSHIARPAGHMLIPRKQYISHLRPWGFHGKTTQLVSPEPPGNINGPLPN